MAHTRKNHSTNPHMEICVKAWDAHRAGDKPLLSLKEFWRQNVGFYGITYNTFFNYARLDKEKRTPLYSQVGRTSRFNRFMSRMGDENVSEAGEEEDDESGCFESRREMDDFLDQEDAMWHQMFRPAICGKKSKLLDAFERWKLQRACVKFDWWLTYYGYHRMPGRQTGKFVQHRLYRELHKFMDELDRIDQASREKQKAPRTPPRPKPIGTLRSPKDWYDEAGRGYNF